MRIAEGHAKRLLCLRGDKTSINAFAEEFREHDSAEAFDRVSEQDAGRLTYFSSRIKYREGNPSVLSILDREGCYQHNTVHVKRGIEHWVIYSKKKGNITKVVTLLKKQNNNVNLDRVIDLGRVSSGRLIEFSTILTALTPRQQAAFETALNLGYYTDENDITMNDIAKELDIHQSTAWEHLKKSENKILSNIGNQVFSSNQIDANEQGQNVAQSVQKASNK